MKKLLTILILCAAGLFAASGDQATTTKKKSTKSAVAKKAPAPQTLTIPTGAIEKPDGTYSYTDKTGKKWLYAKTPFGVMRSVDAEAAPASASSSSPSPAGQFVKATDNGETATFVRQTPFGPIKAEKKKSDLTDEERQILEDQKAKPE